MKVGDLVTVLPARCSIYILLRLVKDEPMNELGSLWELYGVDVGGIALMHEVYINLVGEN